MSGVFVEPRNRRALRINFQIAANQRLRVEVFQRDGYACRFCGARATPPPDYTGRHTLWTDCGRELQIDHIVPACWGGRPTRDNLQTLCLGCNYSKGSRV